MKKTLIVLMVIAMLLMGGCATAEPEPTTTPTPDPTEAPTPTPTPEPKTATFISRVYDEQTRALIEEGVMKGAQEQEIELHIMPATDDGMEVQTDIVNEFNAGADAVMLSAEPDLAVISVLQQLADAQKEYPVVLFGGDIEDAPENSVNAKVFSGQREAGALAADNLLGTEYAQEIVAESTDMVTSVIAVFAENDNDPMVVERVQGFVDRALEILGQTHPGKVKVLSSSQVFKGEDIEDATMSIFVHVPAPAVSLTDSVEALLNTNHMGAIFCANTATYDALIAGTQNGELLMEGEKYGDIPVAAYGNEQSVKDGVASELLIGSCYADPFELGYLLATQTAKVIENPTAEMTTVTVPAVWEAAPVQAEE